MEQTTLTIGGKEYPIRFSMAAITRVMKQLDVNTHGLSEMIQSVLPKEDQQENPDPSVVAEKYQTMITLYCVLAWAGIYSGEKHKNPAMPVTFPTVEHLAEQVEHVSDIAPAFAPFIDAYVKFTGADKIEVKEPGEVQPLQESPSA